MRNTQLKMALCVPLFFSWIFCLPQSSSVLKPLAGNFRIKGKLVNVAEQPSWVYLSYTDKGHTVRDSAEVRNNAYTFTGTILEPV